MNTLTCLSSVQHSVKHQENMSMRSISPNSPLLYSKTGVCRDIPIFLIFDPKHSVGTH